MTFWEAAELAKAAHVKTMWLTHFSPALVKPKDFEYVAQKIFPSSYVAKDRQSITLKFED
jgi:ribonuclease Z